MKKIIASILLSLCALIAIALYQLISYHDNKLHIVFCNVGQGDGILVRTPGGSTIVIDGGPDNSIINCLNKHLPFWQRDISLVMMTHPHADHLQGLMYLFDRYHVGKFVTESLKNKTFGYNQLMKKIATRKTPIGYVLEGDVINFGLAGTNDYLALRIVGPTKEFLDTTSPAGMIGENKEFASLQTLISFGNFTALLTGDSQTQELEDIGAKNLLPNNVSVLQVPHHGSASGLSSKVLDMLRPEAAVISVGLNNLYSHPNPFTLTLLKDAQIPYRRTDQVGDIEIVSDGKTWSMN